MRIIRKTFFSIAVSFFACALVAFVTVLTVAACSGTVTLLFETFGGTEIAPITLPAGERITLPDSPVKEGFTFCGWYTDDAFTKEAVLPQYMPEQGATYYARFQKNPVLTLDCMGGYLNGKSIALPAGEELLPCLRELSPVKAGVTFCGWYIGGEPITERSVMPDEGLTVTARYLADYRVECYLQSCEGEKYELAMGYTAQGLEGESVCPAPPVYEHFYFDEESSSPREQVLSPYTALFLYYYKREQVSLTYSLGTEEASVAGSYGAAVTLAGFEEEGRFLFGWAAEEGGECVYSVGEEIILTEPVTLYAVWGGTYEDGRGSGEVLALCKEEALLIKSGRHGLYLEGELRFSDGTQGRLDGNGYFLLSDSGTYCERFLFAGGIKGVLMLDFPSGTAVYESENGVRAEGEYTYLFDCERNAYTGRYLFEGEESFLFTLQGEYFLREGQETGEYYLYDCATGQYSKDTVLKLNGFGVAMLEGVKTRTGSYRGLFENEWLVTFDEELRLVTFLYIRMLGDTVLERVGVFLLYDAERAGSYTAEDGSTLDLDGYGLQAQYRSGEITISALFTLSGNEVIFSSGERFYLERSTGRFFKKENGEGEG